MLLRRHEPVVGRWETPLHATQGVARQGGYAHGRRYLAVLPAHRVQRGSRRGVHRQLTRAAGPRLSHVRACPSCGEQAPDGARFCPVCGTALGSTPTAHGLRKVVTIVRSDLVGSTKLGEELDPETLRQVLARYFEVMSDVLMRHEGVS